MYKRILVPLDGSKIAEGVLPHVSQLAKALGSEVVLLRVLDPVAGAARCGPSPLVAMRGSASAYLANIRDRLREQAIPTALAVTTGPVVSLAIGEWARRHHADLIVLMSHGFGVAARLVFGSVAQRLLEISPVPVLVIRATPEALHEQEEQEERGLGEELLAKMRVVG